MSEEYDVTFSKDFFIRLENTMLINGITSMMPEDLAAQVKPLLRSFAKRGIPVKTVLEVIMSTEGGDEDG